MTPTRDARAIAQEWQNIHDPDHPREVLDDILTVDMQTIATSFISIEQKLRAAEQRIGLLQRAIDHVVETLGMADGDVIDIGFFAYFVERVKELDALRDGGTGNETT